MSASFSSSDAFWRFASEIATRSRYLRSQESQEFINAVARTCHDRAKPIASGTVFWRAQVGHDWVVDPENGGRMRGPHSERRMKPLEDRAHEGRINPKGIPCLYVSTSREVAMSEVRPWIGSVLSLARFRTSRDVTVVDCSIFHGTTQDNPAPASPDPMEQAVWASIDRAFSRPVTRSDNTAEYAATQLLAEVFKRQGFDGVLYKSALATDGYNVALFDLKCAEQFESSLFQVEHARFTFKEIEG